VGAFGRALVVSAGAPVLAPWIPVPIMSCAWSACPFSCAANDRAWRFSARPITIAVRGRDPGHCGLSESSSCAPTTVTRSLTAFNASSSHRTLVAMLIIVLAALPLVLGYTVFVYRVWRGKVRASRKSTNRLTLRDSAPNCAFFGRALLYAP